MARIDPAEQAGLLLNGPRPWDRAPPLFGKGIPTAPGPGHRSVPERSTAAYPHPSKRLRAPAVTGPRCPRSPLPTRIPTSASTSPIAIASSELCLSGRLQRAAQLSRLPRSLRMAVSNSVGMRWSARSMSCSGVQASPRLRRSTGRLWPASRRRMPSLRSRIPPGQPTRSGFIGCEFRSSIQSRAWEAILHKPRQRWAVTRRESKSGLRDLRSGRADD